MNRAFYGESVSDFLTEAPEAILGKMARANAFDLTQAQRNAWVTEIEILKQTLPGHEGRILFEYSIPRMGRRVDVVLLLDTVVFVIEFKVGADDFHSDAIDQVWDYALDLKNFHEPSHDSYVAPVLVATEAQACEIAVSLTPQGDKLLRPIRSNGETLGETIETVLSFAAGEVIDAPSWEQGRYCPTPTIIEAALALYNGHSVAEISRSDAGAVNLHETTDAISKIIETAKAGPHKAICFVTGVPGAGKTLIGLNIATKHLNESNDMYSVFLSGNGPLVNVLQEALARDRIERAKEADKKVKKGEALSEAKMFVQNVHHYRDEYLRDSRPPIDHVALFDEAQRAWNLEQTAKFMKQKKGLPDFDQSEPEFLISCIDRHENWGVIVCLVGGGQEINTGEAGIAEWVAALDRSFPDWHIHVSDRLTDSEYEAGEVLTSLASRPNVSFTPELHLGVSMRSFRAENVSLLVKQLLDLDAEGARETLSRVGDKYPIVLTRDLGAAKRWLREQARGSERYGIVVSSQAERLKPHAIDVRSPMNPIHWFLSGKEDVRSSYYLESVATEFHIQGLELDWVCVTWDGDFRRSPNGWDHRSFRGDRWTQIHKKERQTYLKNAYRVLLTRARQGMVIVVPPGDPEDETRKPEFYDPTFEYLREIGIPLL
ncbi:MAG: DUF2075 domain-containing protein [Lentisphaerae bacterium]|nr:DUF2075 domain-containing protein [Lentisphaerota bacterium]